MLKDMVLLEMNWFLLYRKVRFRVWAGRRKVKKLVRSPDTGLHFFMDDVLSSGISGVRKMDGFSTTVYGS